jgi:hypothetical protein
MQKPASGSGSAYSYFGLARWIVAGVVLKRLCAGQREKAKDITFLIHGDRFDSIAG